MKTKQVFINKFHELAVLTEHRSEDVKQEVIYRHKKIKNDTL